MDLLYVLIAGVITLLALDVGEAAARSRPQPVRVIHRASQPYDAWNASPASRRAK